MMHHPSQFGSNLNEQDPAATQYSQHPQSFETENNNTFNPKGNVAALRSVIHGQLDMKTPTGKAPSNSSRYQKPAPSPVDPTPSWAKNVKVYEPSGYVDPHLNKHNMGRVLDGPVNPNKFFQGVPPPSYSQVKPGTDTKPPAPPSSKPPVQQTPAQALQAQVLHNEKPPVDPYRPSSKTTSYRIPYDVALDPRHHFGGEFDIDDSASIISSSCTFGDSSEIAAFSAAAEQRHLYEQYRKKLMEEKNELKEGSETPCVSLTEKIPEKMTASMKEPTVSRSLFDTELTPFGHTATATNAAAPSIIQPSLPEVLKQNNPFLDLQTLSIQNSPKQFSTPSPNPFNYSPNNEKRSIDLESSQLLVKPKSPAPYSTSSTDHYGTIRRKHKPVAIDLSSESSKSSPKNRSPHFFGNSFGNGNGFEEKQQGSMKNLSPLSPSYKDQPGIVGKNDILNESLNQAFEIASAIESTKNNYEAPHTPKSLTADRSISDTYPVSSPPPSHPSASTSQQWIPPLTTPVDASSMSNSMMSTSVPNMDDSIVFQGVAGGGGSADSSPDRHEDMSQWYRKMFKQMHKKGDEKDNYNKEEEQLQQRFGEHNNNNRVDPKQLERSQENLHHQNPRRSKTPESSSAFLEQHFEHGPSEQQQNFGQERIKQTASNEDELLRLRAEKLAEELKKEKERKHGFVPSATPSLQNNMDRLNSLLYDFSSDAQENNYKDSYSQQQQPVMTATAVYKFEPRSSRELPLNRGDIVRIIRDVDAYWMEGERNGRCGIFPNSYVQINSGNQSDSQKMRAIYPFTARSDTELSLKRGEIVTRRRQIDSNWLEGSNQIGIVGIFPASYVEPLAEPTVPEVIPQTGFPNRPKTPKMEEQGYNTFNRPVEQVQYPQYQYQQSQQPQQYQPSQQYQSQPVTVAPNNKVRFDLPSSSDSNLNTSLDQIHNYQPQPTSYGGMKKIEYEREKVDEEPILDQYRKLNEPQETKKKETNILMNAASLIPKGSEMYRAVYPYQPQKDDELQLFTNDIIFVVERCDDGWYIGTSLRTGEFGIFPGNYVNRH